MPLYPYRCTKCGNAFDKIQHFDAEPETICPVCGGPLERPMTVPAFNFKGSGWYVNDYASRPGASGSSHATADGGAATTETQTAESKPAAATESTSKPETTPGATPSTTPSATTTTT